MKSRIFNIGFDYSLLNGKITGSFEHFYRKRTGLRGQKNDVLVPVEIGYTLPDENINSDAQYGQEGSVTYNGTYRELRFNITANASYSRNKFLSSYNPLFFNSWDQYRNSNEDRFNRITWGYETIGQFTSVEQINDYPVNIDGKGNTTLLPGDLIYRDVNGDGKINGLDERPIGYATGQQPYINFGFSIGLSYKQFDAHFDFSGGAGYAWWQNWETRWPFQNDGNLNTMFLDRWHRENPMDPKSSWIPGKYPALRFNDGGHSNYNRPSTFWLTNVKYLRARTIEVGYSVAPNILKSIKMTKARVYINAYNLFSLDNMRDFDTDPELIEENGLQYPQTKFLNAGVNLTF